MSILLKPVNLAQQFLPEQEKTLVLDLTEDVESGWLGEDTWSLCSGEFNSLASFGSGEIPAQYVRALSSASTKLEEARIPEENVNSSKTLSGSTDITDTPAKEDAKAPSPRKKAEKVPNSKEKEGDKALCSRGKEPTNDKPTKEKDVEKEGETSTPRKNSPKNDSKDRYKIGLGKVKSDKMEDFKRTLSDPCSIKKHYHRKRTPRKRTKAKKVRSTGKLRNTAQRHKSLSIEEMSSFGRSHSNEAGSRMSCDLSRLPLGRERRSSVMRKIRSGLLHIGKH